MFITNFNIFIFIMLSVSFVFLAIRFYIIFNIIISTFFFLIFYIYYFLYKKLLLERIYFFFSKLKFFFKSDRIDFCINLLYHLLLLIYSIIFFIIFLTSYLVLCLLLILNYLMTLQFYNCISLFCKFLLLCIIIYTLGWYTFFFFFNWFIVLKFLNFLRLEYNKIQNKVNYKIIHLKTFLLYIDFFFKILSVFVCTELFLNYYSKCLSLYAEFLNNNFFNFENCFITFKKFSKTNLLFWINIYFSIFLFIIIYIIYSFITLDFITILLFYWIDIPFNSSHRIIIYILIKKLLKNIFLFMFIYFKIKVTLKLSLIFILILILISLIL